MRDRFDPVVHKRNLLTAPTEPMVNENGDALEGIVGATGVTGERANGEVFGADLVTLSAGRAFPEHTHPSDHIVYVLDGTGSVMIEGVRHSLVTGDAAYIAADVGHGLSAADSTVSLTVMVVSVPHAGVSHPERMKTL